MGLMGSIFDALSSDGNDGGCDWICDSCGAYMTVSQGLAYQAAAGAARSAVHGTTSVKTTSSTKRTMAIWEAINTMSTKKNETAKKKRDFVS